MRRDCKTFLLEEKLECRFAIKIVIHFKSMQHVTFSIENALVAANWLPVYPANGLPKIQHQSVLYELPMGWYNIAQFSGSMSTSFGFTFKFGIG